MVLCRRPCPCVGTSCVLHVNNKSTSRNCALHFALRALLRAISKSYFLVVIDTCICIYYSYLPISRLYRASLLCHCKKVFLRSNGSIFFTSLPRTIPIFCFLQAMSLIFERPTLPLYKVLHAVKLGVKKALP